MFVRLFVMVALVLSSFSSQARSKGSASNGGGGGSPRDVIQKYLAADFSGSRVFKEEKAATTQLVTWSEEPPWDQIIIVGRFTVNKVKIKRKSAKVGVRFANLGELKGDTFYPDPQNEDATFEAVRHGRSWKVDRPILVPHISLTSAEKYLKDQQKGLDPQSERAKALTKTLEDLRTLTKD